jgi:hypothetical protein
VLDLTVLLSVIGALGGVGLGAILTDRTQRALLRETRLGDLAKARETAFVEYLASFRAFRSYLMTEDLTVTVVQRVDGDSTPVVTGSNRYWDTIATARARLHILVDTETDVFKTAEAMTHALVTVAKSRATYGAGEIPTVVLNELRQAELEFAKAARTDLSHHVQVDSKRAAP